MSVLYGYAITLVLSSLVSGFWFYGQGVDRTERRYQQQWVNAEAEARDRYLAREQALLALADQRVRQALAIERQRQPIEQKIIEYVVKENDDSRCVLQHDGLQLISDYINSSF